MSVMKTCASTDRKDCSPELPGFAAQAKQVLMILGVLIVGTLFALYFGHRKPNLHNLMKPTVLILGALMILATADAFAGKFTFGDDVAFLRAHTPAIVLSSPTGAQIVVAPAYQARVLTSTANGPMGESFGWVNRKLVASHKTEPHINAFGGEDRFWIGPEGGQFSVFFAKGATFDLDHWFTPAAFDTEAFEVVSQGTDRIHCRKVTTLTNYSGASFELQVDREIRILDAAETLGRIGIKLPSGVQSVAFESVNTVKNTGREPWRKETGLLSIWILGMFNASPETTVVVPFEKGAESALGQIVNDSYFGKVPGDRLAVKDGVVYFRADANHRSKIGIPPKRVRPVLGSYDAASRILTLVQFTVPKGATDYVNSTWQIQ